MIDNTFVIRNYILEQSSPTLFIDMDGVLTDFRKAFLSKTGKHIESVNDFWNYLKDDEDFWANMEWLPEGKRMWDSVKHLSPTILSSPIKDPSCIRGKNKWIDKHLGKNIPRIFESKKWKYSGPNKILIDDMDKNISPWVTHGGIGIIFDGRERMDNQIYALRQQNLIESVSHSGTRSHIEFFYTDNGEQLGSVEGSMFYQSNLSTDEIDSFYNNFPKLAETPREQIFWLADVSVPVISRGKGIATQLINSAEKWAKSNGFHYIMLRANPSGEQRMTVRELESFYERRGFDTLLDDDFPHSVVMGKSL